MTQEKTFEEMFPSLKGKENAKVMLSDDGISFLFRKQKDCYMFTEFDIQENCLDKAKIKEAIDEGMSLTYEENDIKQTMEKGYSREQAILLLDWGFRVIKNKLLEGLKKELGL